MDPKHRLTIADFVRRMEKWQAKCSQQVSYLVSRDRLPLRPEERTGTTESDRSTYFYRNISNTVSSNPNWTRTGSQKAQQCATGSQPSIQGVGAVERPPDTIKATILEDTSSGYHTEVNPEESTRGHAPQLSVFSAPQSVVTPNPDTAPISAMDTTSNQCLSDRTPLLTGSQGIQTSTIFHSESYQISERRSSSRHYCLWSFYIQPVLECLIMTKTPTGNATK